MNYLLVFLGGGLGCMFRYFISNISASYCTPDQLPLGTLISNVLSCLVLAATLFFATKGELMDAKGVKLLVLVGFCGGLSTFSTFSFETVQLIRNGNHLVAVSNVILSVLACLIVLYKLTK